MVATARAQYGRGPAPALAVAVSGHGTAVAAAVAGRRLLPVPPPGPGRLSVPCVPRVWRRTDAGPILALAVAVPSDDAAAACTAGGRRLHLWHVLLPAARPFSASLGFAQYLGSSLALEPTFMADALLVPVTEEVWALCAASASTPMPRTLASSRCPCLCSRLAFLLYLLLTPHQCQGHWLHQGLFHDI